ncbi:MAG: flavodoxin family protein [Candidatus Saganbacteria bacterium]|nr:flavodoxin family protein [Candidatus Saganbacteria bacterium]
MKIKKILIISGSHKKDGNTATLINWFCEGAKAKGIKTEIIQAASLKSKILGCTSCRKCQKLKEYNCIINDEVSLVLKKMIKSDVIVFATPLYFFAASAPIKAIMDRMFSLYKWDNEADTFETPLRGKTLVLIASAYEDVGLDALEKPFKLTADYTGMKFKSLLVPNAGVSGTLKKNVKVKKQAIGFGKEMGTKPL